METDFTTAIYTRLVREGAPAATIYRFVVHDLPRRFHDLPAGIRARVLEEEPETTGTEWDAVLAAMLEHLAHVHGLAVPEWVDRPERFLDSPWFCSEDRRIREGALLFCPAPFVRHGAFIDPRDLDRRGGEKAAWHPRDAAGTERWPESCC